MSHKTFPKPLLKWAGGKTCLLDKILSFVPKQMNNYVEPFLGGGSVLIAMLSLQSNADIEIKGSIYASDANEVLISMYKNIQSNVNELISELEMLKVNYTNCDDKETFFYAMRQEYNDKCKQDKTTCNLSAIFIFLNKTCFRGLYREGPRGFNVPFGNYKNATIYDESHLRNLSRAFQGVHFLCRPFEAAFLCLQENDFLYLDPPYVAINKSSFVSYTVSKFGTEHHKSLFSLCLELKDKHVNMILSNSSTDLVLKTFQDYNIYPVLCKRRINSKHPENEIDELLITNF